MNWVVVGSDVHVTLVFKVPGWSVVENSLLHCHTVRVSPEGVFIVKVFGFKVDSYFVTNLWVVRETVEFHINVKNIELIADTHVYNSLLVVGVIKTGVSTVRADAIVENKLRSNRAFNNFDTLQLRVSERIILVKSSSENISTTRLGASILLASPVF